VKELAKNVREVSEVKANIRNLQREQAVTDPKEFAKDKLKKQLRLRQRKKEKIREMKFGMKGNDYTEKRKKLKIK